MKKFLSLFVLLVTIVIGAKAEVTPDYESFDWGSADAMNAALDVKTGDVLISVTTSGSDGNVSGHYYKPLNSAIDGAGGTYLQVSSSTQIDKIEVFYCPNGTSDTNLAWAAWGKNVTPSAEVGTYYGETTAIKASKSWDSALWETIDLSEIEAYTVRISRQGKNLTKDGNKISNIGKNQTVNLLGIKVYLVDEGAATHTVTYSLGEGTGTAPTQNDVAEERSFTVAAAPADLVAPTGKEFKCWNDGTNDYKAGASYTMGTSDVTLTAVYMEERPQVVVYSLTDGIGSAAFEAATATVNEGESLIMSDTNGRIKLTPANGFTFKKGDIITLSGTVGNQTKYFGIKYGPTTSLGNGLFKEDAGDGSVSGTLTLTSDAEELYIGRYDGTTTTITSLTIIRKFDAIVTLNDKGYATYSQSFDFTFEGAKAYKMALDEDAKTITGTEVTGKIKAGEGILLRGEAGATVAITETTDAEALDGNDLKGSTLADGSLAEKPANCYVLSGDTFKSFSGATLAAGKAYFAASEDLSIQSFSIVFDDEIATAINGIGEAEAQAVPVKVIKNGKLYIGNYNVAGQQVK